MKNIRRIAVAVLLAAGASSLLGSSTASAGVTTATLTSDPTTSRRHLGSFTGTASYDSDSHKLTVTLDNTTSKGFLTGFAFNASSPMLAKYDDGDVAGTKGDEDAFDQIKKRPKPAKNLKPWGRYVAGATLDGRWNSQKAGRGIAAGASHTFVFDVSGADADCTIADLFNETPLTLIAKFRGLAGNKQDQIGARLQVVSTTVISPPINIVPGAPDPTVPTGGGTTDPIVKPIITPPTGGNGNGGDPQAVPLPPAAWGGLIMLGLTSIAGLRKRFSRSMA